MKDKFAKTPLPKQNRKQLYPLKIDHLPTPSAEDFQILLHEHEVYKIECETQTEELRRFATELETALEKYVDIYEFTSIGYLTLNQDGWIQESNLTGARLLGMERNILLQTSLEMFIHPEFKSVLHAFLKNVFSAMDITHTCEIKLLRRGDARVFLLLEGICISRANPRNSNQCRIAMIDISERKQTEKDLQSFSYSISHDLREPLRAINGFTRMLAKDLEGNTDKEIHRKLHVILGKAERMDKLVAGVLEYSRLGREKLDMKIIDMGSLVQEIWQEFRENYPERNITLKISSLPGCLGDQRLIRQTLTNLLGNAFKFTRSKESAVVEVGGSENPDECVYYVRDNGIGFDMLHSGKLFNLFRRLHSDDEYEGTGSGLAIVKRTVGMHSGRVWAEAIVGEGAAFYFTLPKKNKYS